MSEWLLTPPDSGLPKIAFEDAVAAAEAALPTNLPSRPSELLFALDIDGTLAGQKGVSQRTRDVIAKAEAAGANIVIATGRGIDSTTPIVKDVKLQGGWSVCSNGALTVRWDLGAAGSGHDIISSYEFDPRPVADRLLACLPELLLGVDQGVFGMCVSQPFPDGELWRQTLAPSLDALLANHVTKLVGRAPWLERAEFAEVIDGLGLDWVEYAVGWTSWVDVGPFGVTKASGLKELIERLEIPSEGIIAIGDGMNDVAMLSWAAHGVAMGGAPEALVAVSDAVTAPVECDGAAAVVEAVLRQY